MATAKSANKENTMSFEQSLARLDEIIAMLEKGAGRIQTVFQIPASAAEVLTGIVLFFLLGCEFFVNYKLVFRGGKEKKNG